MMALFVILTSLLFAVEAFPETYMNIGPLDTLDAVKGRFPSANFIKLAPAWAQPSTIRKPAALKYA